MSFGEKGGECGWEWVGWREDRVHYHGGNDNTSTLRTVQVRGGHEGGGLGEIGLERGVPLDFGGVVPIISGGGCGDLGVGVHYGVLQGTAKSGRE